MTGSSLSEIRNRRGLLPRQAGRAFRREYALVYRAGLSNKTAPFEVPLRDKLNNFVLTAIPCSMRKARIICVRRGIGHGNEPLMEEIIKPDTLKRCCELFGLGSRVARGG